MVIMEDFITQSKQDYADLLIGNGKIERAKEIMEADLYTPIFVPREAHPESEPFVKNYNEMVVEAYHDIYTLYVDLRNAASRYDLLMKNVKTRLNSINKDLLYQKSMQEDVNILCNIYSDFDSVTPLTEEDFYGKFGVQNDIFCSNIESYNKVQFDIIDVSGNGYEGNQFVYKDKGFISDSVDTSNRGYINDNSLITAYEYSRITASNKEKEIFNLVNLDQVEARCSITLKGYSAINKITASVSSKDTKIIDVETSDDGINYDSVLKKEIAVNDDAAKYEKQTDYIPNSGLLCFPNSKYIRITFESNAVTDDMIAFTKVEYIPKNSRTRIYANDANATIYQNDNPNGKIETNLIYNHNTGKIIEASFD